MLKNLQKRSCAVHDRASHLSLTLIGTTYKSKKNAHLWDNLGASFIRLSLAGCQIISIDLNFHLQKCLVIFDKNSAAKNQS